jgi:hypothetical protein
MNIKNIFKKTTSFRQYNKLRKRILLGKDDFNNKLYIYDFVKLTQRTNIKTPWISQIFWNVIDGAFINSHPAHAAMNGKISSHRDLREFLGEKYDISHLYQINENEPVNYIPNCSIEKVSYEEYLEWMQSIEGKYDSLREANSK